MNKIEISNPNISLINYINNPPNTPSNNMLTIADSGANIHLAKQTTNTMDSVIMSNEMIARIPGCNTMESSHITTLQI